MGKVAKKILVISPRPLFENRTLWEQQISPFYMRWLLSEESADLRETAAKMDELISRGIRRLEACPHTDTLLLSPNLIEDMLPHTCNLPMQWLAFQNGRDQTERLVKKVGAA